MKNNPTFEKVLQCYNENDFFDYLIDNLKETIKSWDYFVNWKKVIHNYTEAERALNLLNTLVGKENIEKEAYSLLQDYPKVIGVIPALLAEREKKISMLVNPKDFELKRFDFSKAMSASDGVFFLKQSGFLDLIANYKIKSIPDYFIGLEVGLDSNGRKNRSGKTMKNLVEYFIKDICCRNGFDYLIRTNAEKIKQEWNLNVSVSNSINRIDFAIKTPHKLFLIGANFYGCSGSKLKSTAGDYVDIYQKWLNDGHQFIWITDGMGWKSTKKILRQTLNSLDYVLNLDMVQKGILEEILNSAELTETEPIREIA